MITCVVDYTIDPAKLDAFERFARAWIGLVSKHGCQHHGSRYERTFMRPVLDAGPQP